MGSSKNVGIAFFLSLILTTSTLWFIPSHDEHDHHDSDDHDDEHSELHTHPHIHSAGARWTTGSAHVDATEDVLVLMVDFPDANFTFNESYFQDLLFGSTGPSMKTYFDEFTYGQVALTGDIYSPKSLNNSIHYYDDDPYGYFGNVREAIEEAVDTFDADVNYSDYDHDGDGYVDNFMVIFGGPDDATNGDANGDGWSFDTGAFWAHRWELSSDKMTSDGVKVRDYFACPQGCDLGTFAHELTHNFDLPDLYDMDFSSNGIGNWGLMGYGNGVYTMNGTNIPAHPSAWVKSELSLLTPTVVDPSVEMTYTLESANLAPDVLRVNVTSDEYFLIEYRSSTSGSWFDSGNPGSGVLIWHIDENVCNSYFNVNDNEYRPCLRLLQADGNQDLENGGWNRGDSGDPFHLGDMVTASSTPAMVGYDGDDPGVNMTIISMNDTHVEIFIGETTAWFEDVWYEVRDSDGDGFNNEIKVHYDPNTNGENLAIDVEIDLFEMDRAGLLNTYSKNHSINGSNVDDLTNIVGYYNTDGNGLWWIEVRLLVGGVTVDSEVLGNIWIESPKGNNTDDDYIDSFNISALDSDSDDWNESVDISLNWGSFGSSTTADVNVSLFNQDDPSIVYWVEFENQSLGPLNFQIQMEDSNLTPGLIQAYVELFVDGHREDMLNVKDLDLMWAKLNFSTAYVEMDDLDGNQASDTLEVYWQLNHTYPSDTPFIVEVNVFEILSDGNYSQSTTMNQSYPLTIGPITNNSSGGRDLHQTILTTEIEQLAIVEIKAINQLSGKEYTTWIEFSNTGTLPLELSPLDWWVNDVSITLEEYDVNFDEILDSLSVEYQFETNADSRNISVELEITKPDGELNTQWDNYTISNLQSITKMMNYSLENEGDYSVTLRVYDLDDDELEGEYDLENITVNASYATPEISIVLPDNPWQGNECQIEVSVWDEAISILGISGDLTWQVTDATISDNQYNVDCSDWSAGDKEITWSYSNELGLSAQKTGSFEILAVPNLELSFENESYTFTHGENCSITTIISGNDGLVIFATSIDEVGGNNIANSSGLSESTELGCGGLEVGNYTATLSATHPSGLTGTASSWIEIIAPIPVENQTDVDDEPVEPEVTEEGNGFLNLIIALVALVLISGYLIKDRYDKMTLEALSSNKAQSASELDAFFAASIPSEEE